MEWTVPVNEMLQDDITKLNYTLIPPGFRGDVRSVRVMQDSLSKLIDTLGEQSAAAQGLNKVITTADKLRNSSAHILYLLKDSKAKGGKGEAIGMLKVGRKHLFLLDEREQVREVEPLCVLDFFVVGDRQRHGYGRLLFDHMLQDMETSAHELAVDGPSAKMEQFLTKNYCVERLIRQNNNFAVAPQFFHTIDNYITKSGRSTPAAGTPAGGASAAGTPALGRFAARKPHSTIANVIHGSQGGSYYQETNNGSSGIAASPVTEVSAPEAMPKPELKPEGSAVGLEGDVSEPQHKSLERPSSLRVEPLAEALVVAGAGAGGAPSPAGSTASRRDSQLTEQGFFDVKFYHNKLW